ncbi:helix-turn-helix domain-containing protein [Streptomyces niveus]|uniref:helix-turn-helix domain-containing protein n=1 Tax=Streptomyces niveus TaxID=193462 RepID=UPI000D1284CC|nr:helix-turn-helix domain-containing protein [Streptomyces niveus]
MPAPDRAGGESKARPITDDDRRRVRELHAQDKSHNETARAIGRSPSTVSKIAGQFEPPLTLAPQVEAATLRNSAREFRPTQPRYSSWPYSANVRQPVEESAPQLLEGDEGQLQAPRERPEGLGPQPHCSRRAHSRCASQSHQFGRLFPQVKSPS